MERRPGGAGPQPTGTEQEQQHEVPHDGPRIYVASLSDYNAGVLHGSWIDAEQEPDELHEAVQQMLNRSPTAPGAEEFAVHDFEGFGRYRVSEYESLEAISRIARGIAEHGPVFAAWADHVGSDEAALERFDEAFLGEWPSVELYAYSLLDDIGVIKQFEELLPEGLAPYLEIDTHGFSRDMELGGDITAIEGDESVWIFDGRIG